jgi:hypothetical protein
MERDSCRFRCPKHYTVSQSTFGGRLMGNPGVSLAGRIGFLRQAAVELRTLAAHQPEIAPTLRHFADEIKAEAGDLTPLAELG